MTSFQRLYHLRKFGCVKRFHAEKFVGENTTAHHSACVALILIECVPDLSVNLLKAAILHDLEEGITGDIPAPVKWAIGNGVEDLERQVREYFRIDNPDLNPYEENLLAAADIIDATMTCLDQRLMGNRWVDPIFQNYERFAPKLFQNMDQRLAKLEQVWTTTKCAYRCLRDGLPSPILEEADRLSFWNQK